MTLNQYSSKLGYVSAPFDLPAPYVLSMAAKALDVSKTDNVSVQVPAYVPYSGRRSSASPATGFSDVHKREQEELCANAMNLDYGM